MVFAVVLALAAIAITAALDSEPGTAPRTARPLPVGTITVELADGWPVRRELTGEVIARRTAELAFDRTARVEEILVDDGQAVATGDRLARLDTRRLEARRDELTSRRAEQAARLAEMRAGPREETIAAARAEVAEAAAQLEYLRLQAKRRQELAEKGTIADELYDESRFAAAAAEARRDAAQRRLDELHAGTRDEQIAAQEAVVARLDAQLRDVAVELEDSRLTAPFAGTITGRRLDEGALARAGEPILRLVEAGELEARIGLPVNFVERLEIDEPVELLAGERRWRARVRRWLPEVDAATQTRVVVLEIESAGAAPGQIVRLPIVETVEARGFWLPITALRDGARGLWSCLRVVEGADHLTTERCDVEILHTDGERVFVRAPLEPGDRVVADAQHRVVPGQAIEAVPTIRER